MPKPETHDSNHEYLSQIVSDVSEHGWHVVMIEQDEAGPSLAYSIGLQHSFGHPEVMVFGLDVHAMHEMINRIGARVRQGDELVDLHESGQVLDGRNVIFRSVRPAQIAEHMTLVMALYDEPPSSAFVCVWPDDNHHFPWHTDYDQRLAGLQPAVYTSNNWPFHEGKNRRAYVARSVVERGKPVDSVIRDGNGVWQFLSGKVDSDGELKPVLLGDIVDLDSSLEQLATLAPGWQAVRDGDGWLLAQTTPY